MMWLFQLLYLPCAENRSRQKKGEGTRVFFSLFLLFKQSSKSSCGCETRIKVTDTQQLSPSERKCVCVQLQRGCLGVHSLRRLRSYGYFHIRFSFSLAHTLPTTSQNIHQECISMNESYKEARVHTGFFSSRGHTEESDSHVFTPHNVI